MKKILIAASLALGISTASSIASTPALTAHAKAYDLSPTFVKALKNGTLPRAKGKVGMTYSTFTKKGPIIKYKYDKSLQDYSVKNNLNSEDFYSFNKKPSSKAKITQIGRSYNYIISGSSIVKNFGQPFEGACKGFSSYSQTTNIYKAGKYYLYAYFAPKGSAKSPDTDSTFIAIGTKKSIMGIMDMGCTYKRLYR